MQNYQALPVPANQLIGGNWINDPYNTSLPVPNLPFFQQNPNLAWVLATTAAVLVNSLQDNCQGGPVSTFAYNLFSQNRFANELFMLICDEASEFALSQLQANPRGEPIGVVTQAVQFYAAYAAANCAARYPDLTAYMDQAMCDRVNAIITQWRNLSANLQAPQQTTTMGYATAGVGGHPGNVGVGVQLARPGQVDIGQLCATVSVPTTNLGNYAYLGSPAEEDSSRFGATTQQRLRPDAVVQSQVEPELQDLGVVETSQTVVRPAPTVSRLVPDAVEVQVRKQREPTPTAAPASISMSNDIPDLSVFDEDDRWQGSFAHDEEMAEDAEYAEWDEPPVNRPGMFLFRPKHVSATLPKTLAEAELEEEEDLEVLDIVALPKGEDDWSVLELKNGDVAVRVNQDDPGRTWTMDDPHSFPYDPEQFFRYLVKGADNVCYEAFLARDENVEYEDLEFDEAKRARVRQEKLSQQNILADLSVIQDIKPREVPYTLIGTLDELTTLENSADQTKHLEYVERFQGALSFFEASKEAVEVPRAVELVEQFFRQVVSRGAAPATSGFYLREFVAPGLAAKVEAVNAAPDRSQRLAKLGLLIRELLPVNSRAFLYLNKLCTREVNFALAYRTGMEGYSITDFAEDYFALCTHVDETYSEVALQRMVEAIHDALACMTFSYSGDVLTVRHAYRVIGLPVGLSSFHLTSADETTYRVTASNAPELFGLVTTPSEEVDVRNPKVFFFGKDGELFEILPSIWDDGYLTAHRV